MQPILIGPQRAALESLVESGKVTVDVPKRWEHAEDGTMKQRTIEIDATDAQIDRAKRRLATEARRLERVEAERREAERLRRQAEARVPEIKALREAEAHLAHARGELRAIMAAAPSIQERAAEAERGIVEAEAAHAVGDGPASAIKEAKGEAEQARRVAESVKRDHERTQLIAEKWEGKVEEAADLARRKADEVRGDYVQAIKVDLAKIIKAAGELEAMETELRAALPNLQSRIDTSALRQIGKWEREL